LKSIWAVDKEIPRRKKIGLNILLILYILLSNIKKTTSIEVAFFILEPMF
tara:strand:+ start:46 stop:195 length:150 start_codon:yes stop_codon:yes gene_type:complete